MLSLPGIGDMRCDDGLRYMLHMWLSTDPAPWTHARCTFEINWSNNNLCGDLNWWMMQADDHGMRDKICLRSTSLINFNVRRFIDRLIATWTPSRDPDRGHLTIRFATPRVSLDLFASDNTPRFAEVLIDLQAEADAQRELVKLINSGGYCVKR